MEYVPENFQTILFSITKIAKSFYPQVLPPVYILNMNVMYNLINVFQRIEFQLHTYVVVSMSTYPLTNHMYYVAIYV